MSTINAAKNGGDILNTTIPIAEIADRDAQEFLPDEYFDFKSRIHDRLLDLIDLSILDRVEPDMLETGVAGGR